MPLPDLVDDLRFGLQQANQRARTWQDQYVSPETGGFIVGLFRVVFIGERVTEASLNDPVALPFQKSPNSRSIFSAQVLEAEGV